MRLRLLMVILAATWFAETARAEAFAPVTSACLSASASAPEGAGADAPYRIEFQNRCDAPRSFLWCAENPRGRVPAEIACSPSGLAGEQVFTILHRKVFLWRLPQGSRIRFRDCAAQEVPTASFGCSPASALPRR